MAPTWSGSLPVLHIPSPGGRAYAADYGDEGDGALLGVLGLEILGPVFHPCRRTLEPIRALMI